MTVQLTLTENSAGGCGQRWDGTWEPIQRGGPARVVVCWSPRFQRESGIEAAPGARLPFRPGSTPWALRPLVVAYGDAPEFPE